MLGSSIVCEDLGHELYHISVSGVFGGGFCGLRVRGAERAAAQLAFHARRYDCGNEPIIVVAPAAIKELAGLTAGGGVD